MSYEALNAPFTFQDSGAAVAKYPRRLTTSELIAAEELRAAGFGLPSNDYFALKNRLAVQIVARSENRAMVASSAHSRSENFELRRLAQIEAASRRESKTGQRPKLIPKEAVEV